MALTNYTDLKASVADWLNRQDLTPVIPDFIRLLEAQVERSLRVREMFGEVTLTVDEQGKITLPDDFLQIRELRMYDSAGHVVPVAYASPHEITNILEDARSAAGVPRAYCPGKNTVEFAPLPNGTYTVKLQYLQKLPKLGVVQSNWLLEQHPDVYLYGSLMQAAPYLKNDERIAVWGSALTTLLEDMRVADERALKAGTPLKMRFRPYG